MSISHRPPMDPPATAHFGGSPAPNDWVGDNVRYVTMARWIPTLFPVVPPAWKNSAGGSLFSLSYGHPGPTPGSKPGPTQTRMSHTTYAQAMCALTHGEMPLTCIPAWCAFCQSPFVRTQGCMNGTHQAPTPPAAVSQQTQSPVQESEGKEGGGSFSDGKPGEGLRTPSHHKSAHAPCTFAYTCREVSRACRIPTWTRVLHTRAQARSLQRMHRHQACSTHAAPAATAAQTHSRMRRDATCPTRHTEVPSRRQTSRRSCRAARAGVRGKRRGCCP